MSNVKKCKKTFIQRSQCEGFTQNGKRCCNFVKKGCLKYCYLHATKPKSGPKGCTDGDGKFYGKDEQVTTQSKIHSMAKNKSPVLMQYIETPSEPITTKEIKAIKQEMQEDAILIQHINEDGVLYTLLIERPYQNFNAKNANDFSRVKKMLTTDYQVIDYILRQFDVEWMDNTKIDKLIQEISSITGVNGYQDFVNLVNENRVCAQYYQEQSWGKWGWSWLGFEYKGDSPKVIKSVYFCNNFNNMTFGVSEQNVFKRLLLWAAMASNNFGGYIYQKGSDTVTYFYLLGNKSFDNIMYGLTQTAYAVGYVSTLGKNVVFNQYTMIMSMCGTLFYTFMNLNSGNWEKFKELTLYLKDFDIENITKLIKDTDSFQALLPYLQYYAPTYFSVPIIEEMPEPTLMELLKAYNFSKAFDAIKDQNIGTVKWQSLYNILSSNTVTYIIGTGATAVALIYFYQKMKDNMYAYVYAGVWIKEYMLTPLLGQVDVGVRNTAVLSHLGMAYFSQGGQKVIGNVDEASKDLVHRTKRYVKDNLTEGGRQLRENMDRRRRGFSEGMEARVYSSVRAGGRNVRNKLRDLFSYFSIWNLPKYCLVLIKKLSTILLKSVITVNKKMGIVGTGIYMTFLFSSLIGSGLWIYSFIAYILSIVLNIIFKSFASFSPIIHMFSEFLLWLYSDEPPTENEVKNRRKRLLKDVQNQLNNIVSLYIDSKLIDMIFSGYLNGNIITSITAMKYISTIESMKYKSIMLMIGILNVGLSIIAGGPNLETIVSSFLGLAYLMPSAALHEFIKIIFDHGYNVMYGKEIRDVERAIDEISLENEKV